MRPTAFGGKGPRPSAAGVLKRDDVSASQRQPSSRGAAGGRRAAKRPQAPTRARLQAAEARAARTVVVPVAGEEPEEGPVSPERPAGRVAAARRHRTGARTVTLTRAQEYAFIQGDLRRLLVTAGALLALMLVLLVLVER